MDERQWIHAIQKGDKRYLQDIVEKYYDDIFRFCAFQSGSGEDAYDLAQETFLKFIRYVESCRYGNLKGYLLTIAMNLCRDYLAEKRKRREKEISYDQSIPGENDPEGDSLWEIYRPSEMRSGEAEISPEAKLVENDVYGRLMNLLSELPRIQREALIFRYMYDMKYQEIAKLTGVTVSTVKSRVKQGTEKLRGRMEKEEFLDG